MTLKMKDALEKIWAEYKGLPDFVKENGFLFCENSTQKDVLIVGINPSFRKEDRKDIWHYSFHNAIKGNDPHWSCMLEIVGNIDINKVAYLDLFYFRKKDQKESLNSILKSESGISFLAEQLELTMKCIETVIRPNVIVVKNKGAWGFFGKHRKGDKGVWMGYDLEKVEIEDEKYLGYGELYRITGLAKSKERIAKDIEHTNLNGSYILFSKYPNRPLTPREKEYPIRYNVRRPFNPNLIWHLLDKQAISACEKKG